MADVRPLEAVHYNLNRVGSLESVIAPPYDIIGPQLRSELAARSPYNVVEVDLPQGDDPYGQAGSTFKQWLDGGILEREQGPAFWILTQDYSGPDGNHHSRYGVFARVRAQPFSEGVIRPHERTHAGPIEDRLKLTRATKTNLSPIFSLFSDGDGQVTRQLEEVVSGGEPWAKAKDEDGAVNRLWRVNDRGAVSRLEELFANKELLIADGHHRYATAVAYAQEVGGEGPHSYTLMCLVAMEDPGLKVFPTHRVIKGISADELAKLMAAVGSNFEASEVPLDELLPANGSSPTQLGLIAKPEQRPLMLTLKSQGLAESALAGHSPAYQKLNTAILESILLQGALGSAQEEMLQKGLLTYVTDAGEARSSVMAGEADAAFFLGPTPVEQIRAIAAAGESMPPKSTYFYPKLPSGLLFLPLE